MILSGIFAFAAYSKFKDPFAFGQQILSYDLGLPYGMIDTLVWAVPVAEVALAVFLILGIYTRIHASIASLLIAFFTALVLSAMWRGLDIDCGCFGVPQKVGWPKIGENLAILAISLTLIKWPKAPTPNPSQEGLL
jgi:uncharacterized membrane protein YphA (DoxX/SURF4 family)